MTFSWSKQRALIVGVAVVLVTNVIVLSGAAFNRSGEPTSRMELTERELVIAQRDWLDNDNSGVDLRLRWNMRARMPSPDDPYMFFAWSHDLHWLTDAQKQQLGFAAPGEEIPNGGRAWNPLARRAFVVLECDGPSYREVIEQAQAHLLRETELAAANAGVEEFVERVASAEKQLHSLQKYASRLFVIDVDRDAATLRARYPDRTRHAIVPARLDAYLRGEPGAQQTVVHIEQLEVDMLSVPYAFRTIVEPLAQGARRYGYEEREPRFTAVVQWGRRWEPWIVGMTALVPKSE